MEKINFASSQEQEKTTHPWKRYARKVLLSLVYAGAFGSTMELQAQTKEDQPFAERYKKLLELENSLNTKKVEDGVVRLAIVGDSWLMETDNKDLGDIKPEKRAYYDDKFLKNELEYELIEENTADEHGGCELKIVSRDDAPRMIEKEKQLLKEFGRESKEKELGQYERINYYVVVSSRTEDGELIYYIDLYTMEVENNDHGVAVDHLEWCVPQEVLNADQNSSRLQQDENFDPNPAFTKLVSEIKEEVWKAVQK